MGHSGKRVPRNIRAEVNSEHGRNRTSLEQTQFYIELGKPPSGDGTWRRPQAHETLSVFLQKEERTMLEDIWVTLSELDNVTFSFKQLDENYVASE